MNMRTVKRTNNSGFTLAETVVVIAIAALLLFFAAVRFNYYKARQATRSACEIFISDAKLLQQMAYTLEREQKIIIAPGGNRYEYMIVTSEPGAPRRIIDFKNLCALHVCFTSGQENVELIFYPYTATALNEWSIVQKNNVDRVFITGGDLVCTINITSDGKLSISERKL